LRRIVLAYTVNRLGTWLGYVALALGVFDHTHSALAVAGLLVASSLLPALIAPALVARIEATSRRGELAGLYAIEAVTTALLALLLVHFWLPGVLVLGAIDGTAALAANSLLRAAAARSGMEDSTSTDQLFEGGGKSSDGDLAEIGARKANAALNIGFTATFAIGPGVAGLIVATAGGSAALLIDAATFLACGGLLLNLRPYVDEGARSSVRSRLQAAWEHMHAVPKLRAILLTEAVAVIFFAAAPPVEVLYAKETLHAGDSGYGLLLAVWGAGTVIGSFIFARAVRRSLGPMLTGGTLLVGLAYLGWAAFPTLAIACAIAVIGGLGNGVQWAALISTVQKLTPSQLQGRMMSAVESIGAFCPALGFALGGTIAVLSSPRGAFLLAGGAASAVTIVFLRICADGLGARVADAPSSASNSPAAELSGWPEVVVPSTVKEPGLADARGSEVT
jgi:hypothetical protein